MAKKYKQPLSVRLAQYFTNPAGCWVWTGGVSTTTGYSKLKVAGKSLSAHRLMYEHLVGEIPKGLVLDHLCRNRQCVNPAHLEPVTHAENCRRGDQAKITQSIADEIRALYKAGKSQYEIAKIHKVSRPLVGYIVNNKIWST